MPKIEQSELLKKDMLVVRNGNNGDVLRVIFPNGIKVGLEAAGFAKGVELPYLLTPPDPVSNILYATNGQLYWNGGAIAGLGSSFAQAAGHTIQADGTSLSDRTKLNFTTGFTTTDSAGTDASIVAIDVTDFNLDANIILAAQIFG